MKIVLKVLALPLLFIVTVACILGNLITNISSYVIALLLLVIAGCSIYCIVKALWTSLAILAGMGLAAILIIFLLVWAVVKLRNFGKSYQGIYLLLRWEKRMDRGFMEHYFDVTFNDAIGEIAGNDERYAELQSVADEAVHTLAGIVGKSNTALWEQCEHTINSLYTLQLQLVKLAYLRGAEDREKMLR